MKITLLSLLLICWFANPLSAVQTQDPGLHSTHDLLYHPDLEQVIMLNGFANNDLSVESDLWAWDGAAWSLLGTGGPTRRHVQEHQILSIDLLSTAS